MKLHPKTGKTESPFPHALEKSAMERCADPLCSQTFEQTGLAIEHDDYSNATAGAVDQVLGKPKLGVTW